MNLENQRYRVLERKASQGKIFEQQAQRNQKFKSFSGRVGHTRTTLEREYTRRRDKPLWINQSDLFDLRVVDEPRILAPSGRGVSIEG